MIQEKENYSSINQSVQADGNVNQAGGNIEVNSQAKNAGPNISINVVISVFIISIVVFGGMAFGLYILSNGGGPTQNQSAPVLEN